MARQRTGAATIEAAVALGIFFLLCLAVFDLGLATFRHNALSAAARGVAREAAVHGQHAPPERNSWGPDSFAGKADASAPIAQVARPMLPTMPGDEVQITVTWLDDSIAEGSRVHVRLDFEHRCFVPLFVFSGSIPLKAEATMRLVN